VLRIGSVWGLDYPFTEAFAAERSL
jgi:hypothetical protein